MDEEEDQSEFSTILFPAQKEEKIANYQNIYQGTVTNTSVTVSKKTKPTNIDNQMAVYDLSYMGGGEVILTNPNENELSLTTSQLLDLITIHLTKIIPHGISEDELNSNRFLNCKFSVSDYMQLRGLSDKNQAVKQIKKDLETLFNMRMKANVRTPELDEKTGKTIYSMKEWDIRVIDAKPSGRIFDYASFHVSSVFANYLRRSQIMAYPLPILLTAKNKSIYYIGRKLAEHYNINQFKAKRTSDKNYISINALLLYTPEIPSFDEESTRGQHYRQKCIEPLEKTMEALVELGIVDIWHFTNSNKIDLTDEELYQYRISLTEWKSRLLYFELKGYPKPRRKRVVKASTSDESK